MESIRQNIRDISLNLSFHTILTQKLNLEVLTENNADADAVSDKISTVLSISFSTGLGQRGLIVAAPRTGKTVLMQNIANAILVNNPDVYIVLLVDERQKKLLR